MANKRFQRTEALLGHSKMQKLANASVMVVGLGAVGGYALEALARSGIGKLILADFDKVEETNINRQILALSSTLGQKKTAVAKQRVLDINPNCQVIIKDMFVNANNVAELLQENPTFVIDAIDALNPKCALIEALYKANIPFISSMGAALKTKPEFIKCAKLSNSKNCSLAKFIRKRLRKRGLEISQINCVFSEEQVNLPESALFMESEQAENGRQRHCMGSLPTITAIFGLTLANFAITEISK